MIDESPITAADIFQVERAPLATWRTTLQRDGLPQPTPNRVIRLTPASTVQVRPVHWLWQERVALGSICLLGGREGIGKSILAYTLAADLTQGRLPGVFSGQPKSVIVAATEDSWAHTIVPRLMAANANLTKIYRVDVHTEDGADVPLSMPVDLGELASAAKDTDTRLILLDPLLSRLDAKLDSHKDANVRQALEPLAALAEETRAAILGLIHVNKSSSTDPLSLLMGSRAFAAVARSVMFCMADPDDEHNRILGLPKNNLGRTDLPTRTFKIQPEKVAETDDGDVWTGKLVWGEDSTRTVQDALVATKDVQDGDTPAINDTSEWLLDYLQQAGGEADSASVKTAAKHEGHAIRTLTRARTKVRVIAESRGFPKRTYWRLPPASRLAGDVLTI